MLGQQINSELLVDRIGAIMRARLPAGVSVSYFDEFFRRHRPSMVRVVDIRVNAREVRPDPTRGELRPHPQPAPRPVPPQPAPSQPPSREPRPLELLPELWSPAQRTQANLRAMELLATKEPEHLTDEERRAVVRYSGWGGLSIERVADRFPEGFPAPDSRTLIHEYYTPSRIANEVARVVTPFLAELVDDGQAIQALEPSAGIGRFLHAFYRLEHSGEIPPIDWTAVELSPVSARLLRALYPEAVVANLPFERWVREFGEAHRGRFQLVVANPPYGPRGALAVEDPDKRYRLRQAYLYFLIRGLELLEGGGIGVFLIPSGFLTARKYAALRETALRSSHLMAAFRLPSQSETTSDPIFPGANLVTDLLFFQARGGRLAEVLPDDQVIVEGRYYEAFPEHVLGRVYDGDQNDDHTARPRRRYAVIGDFERLPDFDPRPLQTGLFVQEATRSASRRGGVTREIDEVAGLPPELDEAVKLGLRVDTFLAQVSRGDTEHAAQAWAELNRDLLAWRENHGNPHQKAGLLELAGRGVVGAQRFLAGFARDGELAEALAGAPKHEPVYRGEPNLLSQADWLYRQHGKLKISTVARAFNDLTGQGVSPMEAIVVLCKAGWCLDAKDWSKPVGELWVLPSSVYYTGNLWPKVDRCRAGLNQGELYSTLRTQLSTQLDQLMAAIKPSVFEDIADGLTPRETWLPVEVVAAWVNDTIAGKGWQHNPVKLFRDKGLLQIEGLDYRALTEGKKSVAQLPVDEQTVWFLGWSNHHLAIFRPPQPKEIIDGVPQKKPLDEVRLEIAAEWNKSFAEWLSTHEEARQAVEEAYNRTLRGFVAPTYSGEPLHIARWTPDGPRLYEYQTRAARRILANRCGLLAFDVGLGKTFTGIAILARARQEGWARRPVVVVPNSIVWKWYRDFQKCLPDYRVLVIGSRHKIVASGPRKGRLIAETDTPAERAEKWSAFQAGRADVVLLTYSALGRTRIDPELLYDYVDHVTAIQRRIKLSQAKSKDKKKLSERDEAVLQETVEGWVAERLEANANWDYDPGIEWHSLGVDLIICDEAQNFKNLFLPEEREGGIPDAMGGSVESKRAWQLDFRCASVRKHSGGAGVILLSATPAKNGPVEFYNAVHLIQPRAWERVGITDPEAFIDRYCAFEAKTAQTPDGKLTVRQACTSFKNLHELRDVVFRYADFKTAEDVGLKIPDAQNFEHRVDLDDDQVEAIRDAWAEIRDLREEMKHMHGEAAAKMREAVRLKIMGIAMRVDLIAIHPDLPGASSLKRKEIEAIDPHSGKIDAVVEEVLATDDSACDKNDPDWCLNCGHIIFVENIAVHLWLRNALIEAGIPEERIAILNAAVASDPETRQQIAEQFNGVGRPGDEDHEPPRYDVVIANSVAYEGVDLQIRTCAIHHVDLPWEPATLQQRNGRGVRQGNKFERVKLHYYLGRPSGDGRRLTLIANKRSWMASLVHSQDRVTNNPAAAVTGSLEDILLDIVPPEERERVLREREEEAKKLAEAQAQRARIGANKLLSQANARFRRAESTADAAEAGRLRAEGESILADLAKIDAKAWPWLEAAQRARTVALFIPEEGPPLWPRLRLRLAGQPTEVGLTGIDSEGHLVVGTHHPGDAYWRGTDHHTMNAYARDLTPADLHLEEVSEVPLDKAVAVLRDQLRYSTWPELGWQLAPDAWREQWWPRVAEAVVTRLKEYAWRHPRLPIAVPEGLAIATDAQLSLVDSPDLVVPPTEAGWKRFLELAAHSPLKFTELNDVAQFWWGRRMPRGLQAAARRETTEALRPPGWDGRTARAGHRQSRRRGRDAADSS